MAGTWEELVSKIKDKLDIVDVISEQVVLKKRGQSYWGLCPFHKDKNLESWDTSFLPNKSKDVGAGIMPIS